MHKITLIEIEVLSWWRNKGKGKRGGVRTIYLYLSEKDHIHFLTIYAKNEMTDLTADQKKVLKAIAEEIKND